jgi:hypothetical protein
MKIAGHDARAHIGEKPTAHFVIDLRPSPVAFPGSRFRTGIGELFRILGKNRDGQAKAFWLGQGDWPGCGIHQQIVNVDINAKFGDCGHTVLSPRPL